MTAIEQIRAAGPTADLARETVARAWRMSIDGARVAAISGETIEVVDPSTGTRIAEAPRGGAEDVDLAVRAARRSFEEGDWTRLGAVERGRRLARVAELIERDAARLQSVEILNNGVTPFIAQYFTTFAADAFRYYAGWCDKVGGATADLTGPDGEFHAYTLREPVGVAGLIVPWNGPLASASLKLATALAAGCSCVVKPAEETPLSALLLADLLDEAGIPPGVVNIVTGLGHEAGAALASHPCVDKISFTGSTEVGKRIVQAATGNLKKLSLELGGKSPVLIFEDADLDLAIRSAAMGTFFNTGQVCVAGSRVYVQRSIFDRVVAGMAEVGAALRIGGGFDETAELGPLISEKQLDRVSRMVETARLEGATIAGGGAGGDSGFYYRPAVISGAAAQSEIAREEVFGPVIVAMPFDTLDDAVRLANETSYGLAAAIWTRDINRAHRFARRVKAGTVWINCQLILNNAMPFGGYKQSGWGRENGFDGIDSFMQVKSVIAALG